MKQDLLSFDDALARLLAQARVVAGVEELPLMQACGRVLAREIRSTIDVPATDNAQMDGYAVRVADVAPGRTLAVSQRIAAGQVGQPLQAGTVARIFTGAPVPAGADAVVMQEMATQGETGVTFQEVPCAGQWIRRQAEDIAAQGVVLKAGVLLTPQAVGMAASVGVASVAVYRRLRIACLFTGDELMDPGQPLRPGAIYNSNRFMQVSLFRQLGCDVVDLGNVPDTLEATRAALRQAASGSDLIISCGGMSVGEEDHVKPAVQADGELTMWSIAIKPGKPLAHGRVRRADGSLVDFIGLPGNPVSALVTFLMFGRAFVRRLQGMSDVEPRRLSLRADFDWPRPDRRREFLRARINDQGGLDLFPNQGSAVLTSTVWGDGLIDNPAGQAIGRGDLVRFLPFAELLH